MDVNVKVTIDLGDKTMSLFGGLMAANHAVAKAANTTNGVLKKYADEPVEDKEPETRNARPEPVADRNETDDEGRRPCTEEELKDMSPKELTAILKDEFGINPDDFDGKNTNKKLRDLILDAQDGKLRADDESDNARSGPSNGVTHDDVRDLMAEVFEADEDNRPKVLKQLNKIGAKSIGAIQKEDLPEFFEFLQSLKDA